ncbi:uncharacterized protein LOC117300993 [Asterias rubens]|uniref:uncharacterized protein LOC117300993 n=1 Tax=Asterias rubens TaxID=7604 RepID=UPI001455A52A|nr:uncharacterized protein LOC117300993 [Asterias rubens]
MAWKQLVYLLLIFTQVILTMASDHAKGDLGIPMPPKNAPLRRQARGATGTRNGVFPVTKSNITVGVCSDKHLCSSLGCQPMLDFYGEPPNLCNCDTDCVFFDDCCQDYTGTCDGSAQQSYNSSGINLEGFEPQSFSCIAPTENSKEYLLVTNCPKDTTDTQTTVQCENPDQDDVFATIPCYGTNNGVHYRNIYCGLCHGEEQTDLIPWEILVDCGDQQSKSNSAAELLQNSISNLNQVENELGCDVIFKVSKTEGILVPPRGCYPDVIRHCPTAEDALSDACESYTALTTVTNLGEQLFRNPHCALCNLPNGPDRVDLATDCSKDIPVFYLRGIVPKRPTVVRPVPRPFPGPDGSKGPPGGGSEGPLGGGSDKRPGIPGPPDVAPPPISIIFNFRSRGRVQVSRDSEILATTETIECSVNEVYNPFLSMCRKLSCSAGYLLDGNQCVPDFGSMGQACGDREGGDDDIEIGVTVTFGDQCEAGLPSELDSLRDEEVRECIAREIPELGERLDIVSSSLPSPACAGIAKFSFMAAGRNTTFGALRHELKISLAISESPLCWMFNVSDTWSVEVHQQCERLLEESCNDRWINETEFSISVQNDTTFVYVNASKSWFPLNQTIVRANFKRRENLFDQFTDLQICAEKTLSCPLEVFNSSLFQDDVDNPGAVVYTPTGDVFNKSEYVRHGEMIGVCSFNTNPPSQPPQQNPGKLPQWQVTAQQILSLVGNIISMVAAAATFATYCLFKELRKRISVAIMGLVSSLFMAQLLLLLSGTATSNPAACTAVAFLGHFFWLSAVLWTSVLAFDLHRTFAYGSKIRRLDLEMRTFLLEVLFTVCVAMVIVMPCLVIHLCDCTDIPLWYGDENVCWIGDGFTNLIAFGLPIGIIVLVNIVLFSFTVRGIRSAKRQTEGMLRSDESKERRMRNELVIYVKISSLMGFTWIFGFAAAFSDLAALWYIFIILNSCQGLLIFLSFICNKKVWSLWRNYLRCGTKVKRPSKDRSNMSTVPSRTTPVSNTNTMSSSRDTTL